MKVSNSLVEFAVGMCPEATNPEFTVSISTRNVPKKQEGGKMYKVSQPLRRHVILSGPKPKKATSPPPPNGLLHIPCQTETAFLKARKSDHLGTNFQKGFYRPTSRLRLGLPCHGQSPDSPFITDIGEFACHVNKHRMNFVPAKSRRGLGNCGAVCTDSATIEMIDIANAQKSPSATAGFSSTGNVISD